MRRLKFDDSVEMGMGKSKMGVSNFEIRKIG